MKKVDHIQHLEDLIFSMQDKMPILLKEMFNNLSEGTNYTIKYDGSPSVLMGNDPVDGKFFVSTKSIFNKTGAVYYKSIEDIGTIKNIGLRHAMKTLFESYSTLPFKGIYQGDLMWTREDLKVEKNCVRFRTNTLSYMCSGLLMDAVTRSKCGVVFHTRYEGVSLSDLHVSDGTLIYVPASIEACSLLPTLRKPISLLDNSVLRLPIPSIADHVICDYDVEIDAEVLPHLKKFLSYRLKLTRETFLSRFLGHIADFYMVEEDDRKSFRGKLSVRDKFNHVVEWVKENGDFLYCMYKDYEGIVFLKNYMLKELNWRSMFQTFLIEDGEYIPTDQEGFVYKNEDIILKLVDRTSFTVANRINSLNLRR